jgi:hypothetical protein
LPSMRPFFWHGGTSNLGPTPYPMRSVVVKVIDLALIRGVVDKA